MSAMPDIEMERHTFPTATAKEAEAVAKELCSPAHEENQEICVSLSMPCVTAGPETQQNPIRFKNLLRSTREQLEALGLGEEQIASLVRALESFQEEPDFWRHQSPGLALFLLGSTLHVCHVPEAVEERVEVSHRPHVAAILPYLNRQEPRYYALVLRQKGPSLYRGHRFGLEPVELPSSVVSIDVLNEEHQKHLQHHSSSPRNGGNGGRHTPIYHGQGATNDEQKKDQILRYFRKLSEEVASIIDDPKAPLALCGVDFLHAIYRDASDHGDQLLEGLASEPPEDDLPSFHEQLWSAIAPHFEAQLTPITEDEQFYASAEHVSGEFTQIVPAAHHGRIAHLIVEKGHTVWGRYSNDEHKVSIAKDPKPDHDELINLAVLETLRHGGDVHLVSEAQNPKDGPCTAVFRY